MAGNIIDPKQWSGVPGKAANIYKDISEGQLARAERKLVNDCRKELPKLLHKLEDNWTSATRLQDTLNHATIQNSQTYQDVAFSQIKLNQTTEWATVLNSEQFAQAARAVEGASGRSAHNTGVLAANSKLISEQFKHLAASADQVVHEIHGIQVIGKSLVDHISYYGRWMQVVAIIQIAQAYEVIQVLTEISEHLGEANNINVSGSGGPNGFAAHVYDLVKERTEAISPMESLNHRFFVYHPDTNWYGAFNRLIRDNPLSPTFCAKSDNLDSLCRYMQAVRTQLSTESECGKDVVLHLLIPSWYRVSIKQPLHFPDCLQPFRVEGRKHKGRPLIEFNLPAAPTGMLDGVANILDPKSQNMIARGVSVAVTGPTVGWGLNGACLAAGLGVGALTGLGALVAVPIWFGTGMYALPAAGEVIEETIYNALCEEAPRVLGSEERLNMAGRH